MALETDRYAARIGATLPDGVALLTPIVVAALEEELAREPHGPTLVWTFDTDRAQRAMDDMGVTPDSPTRAFLADYPAGVLVVALARLDDPPPASLRERVADAIANESVELMDGRSAVPTEALDALIR